MDFLPFYIYWILGGDLSSHFARCESKSAGDTGICISEWSCTGIAKGINIGFCEVDQLENICCKIPTLNSSAEIQPSTILEVKIFDRNKTKPTKNSAGVHQIKDFPIGSIRNHSHKLIEKNSSVIWKIEAPIVDYRNPVEVEVNHDKRSPVEVEVNHDKRSPVEVEVNHDKRSPVEVEVNHDKRSSVEVEVNHNMRIPVEVEVNHDMRIPVEVEINHNMRSPVEQVEDFNLRRPILPDESHDLRWPVLDVYTSDFFKTLPYYNTEIYVRERINMGKNKINVDKMNSKEDSIYNVNDNFEKFYKYPLDKISGENNDYIRCVENSFSTHSNISNQYMQMQKAEDKFYKEMLEASSEVCGRSNTTASAKLVGGKNSVYLQWPWMVSLRQRFRNRSRHKCGAALLNNLWVVTAAHCVDLVPVFNLALRLGNHNLNKNDELHTYVVRYINRIIKHQKFNPTSYENDIALLLMDAPVEFRPNIIPICLPKKIVAIEGRIATVLGWGKVKEGGYLSGTLQEFSLPVMNNRQCEEMYTKVGPKEEIKDVFLCAGTTEGGVDTCDGDSGGPMLILDTEDRWALIGLVSWGKVCGAPYQPGVYTRITEYVDWIDGILACHILKKEFE